MPYPVSVTIEVNLACRNRLTTALRPILAIPHAIVVGPLWDQRTGGVGLLGAAAYVLAIVNWCSLVVTGVSMKGIDDFALFYLRWRARAIAYLALFTDQYPPFGDAQYPVTIEVHRPEAVRDRASIALRLLLVIPHLLLLGILLFCWFVTTILSWFAILFTGSYPAGLHPLGSGVMRWALRVEAYLLLLVDEYPPFTLQ